MKRVVVTRAIMGFIQMQVCCVKDAADEEILKVCNQENPSGLAKGWCEVVRKDPEAPQCNPVTCSDDPERLHILVRC